MAFQDAVALKRQEELIREEASERAGIVVKAKRSSAEKKRCGKNVLCYCHMAYSLIFHH